MTSPSPAEILLELARRAKAKRGEAFPRELIESLHPKQRAFVEDPARSKAALCGRRAGKSRGTAVWLLQGGWSDPGGMSVYVARSKGDARRILGTELDEINKQFKLGLWSREIDNQLYYQLPNGHRIWLAGAKNQAEAEKFRGPKYRRVAIDEAQMYSFLEYMVKGIFRMALMDKKGEMSLTGTPGAVPAGFFYSATTGDGMVQWSTHAWTVYDNPFVHDVEEEVLAICKDYGITDFAKRHEHPTFRREVLGQWVLDLAVLVAPFIAEKNGFRVVEVTKERVEFVVGTDIKVFSPDDFDFAVVVDLGAGDTASTAFVTLAQHRRFPETYIIAAEKRANMIPSTIAAHAEQLARALPKWPQIVVDEGGLGKGYADEMRLTYGLSNIPAEKKKKRAFIELFSGDLKTGSIKVDPYKCRPLIDEMQLCQWNEDKSEIDLRFEDHAIMGAVYGARALRPNYRPEENPPKPGTPEWFRAETKRERELVQAQVRKRLKNKGRVAWR